MPPLRLICRDDAAYTIGAAKESSMQIDPKTPPPDLAITVRRALEEAGAWIVAYREFRTTKGRRGYLSAIRASKDPTIFTVLLEDSAAMLGLVAAVLDGFQLAGFWSALFGSVLISIFSAVGSNFIGPSGHIEVIVRRD